MRKFRYSCLKKGEPTGIWACDKCRLRYAEKILLREWRLIGRSTRSDDHCDLCAENLVEPGDDVWPQTGDSV